MGAASPPSDVDPIHKFEYKVRDLNTVSVTLFPTRAQVWREIKGIELKHGTNEITVVGISPTVDSDSIKIEGNGSATITDIAVELLPNREIFEEIYPDSDADSDSDEDDESSDDEKPEHYNLTSAKDALTQLEDELELAKEDIASALRRLQILDDYGKTLDRKRNVVIHESLEVYKEQRSKAFEDHMAGNKRQRDLHKQIEKAAKKVSKLEREEYRQMLKDNKEKAKAKKEKAKDRLKKERRKEEARKEKQRIRAEREKFWPKLCYSAKITLEAAAFTPMSSRRASMASDVDFSKASVSEVEGKDNGPIECDLVLSYVTSSAFWSPNYDLQLSTTNASASLYFDAMLKNFTSETWSNCKVTLSTSQATFSGLEDAIPTLLPWRIKLASKNTGIYENDILRSYEERQAWMANQAQQRAPQQNQKQWSEMFGAAERNIYSSTVTRKKRTVVPAYQSDSRRSAIPPPPPPPLQQPITAVPPAPTRSGALFGSAAPRPAPGGLFGSAAPQQSSNAWVGGARIAAAPAQYSMAEESEAEDGLEDDEEQPDLDFQESLMEETGLTTTYDLPGLKTLATKSAGSKQRVARIAFSNVFFSHTVVAKYKPVAYLKAKLKNNSKLTLLKGTAGLTLDGTFMGKTSLPRCSAGETFSLSLGVDPAIKVSYPKPDVRRATTGLFSKDNSSTYVRTITLHNTRVSAGRAVNLLVLDQIPVSEDERLRVELVDPRGLVVEGSGAAAGVPGRETREDRDWGKASAKLKKGGEVNWDVSLDAGKAVKLSLEYAVAIPGGDFALQV